MGISTGRSHRRPGVFYDLASQSPRHHSVEELLGGVDEAGRGPLAGPVVAACVILPPSFNFPLADSKQLTAEKREIAYGEILRGALAVGVGLVSERLIDRINIRQATLLAMRAAVENLTIIPTRLIIDGLDRIPLVSIRQQPEVDGDARFPVVSAASIIAKVTRDRIMKQLHGQWPLYDFFQHKGYGTAAHRDQIARYGPCPLHRHSFTLG